MIAKLICGSFPQSECWREALGRSSWVELMSKLGDIPKAKTLSFVVMIQGFV